MAAGLEEDIQRLAALDDPLRRRIYLFVRAQHRPVTREDVAGEAGVSRSLAAFHLDKLVERGWLQAGYGRPAGQGGPGSGVFLQVTCDDAKDVAVPGQKYTFGIFKSAQARGDFQVLAERGRRALRVHLGPDVAAGLRTLTAAIEKTLA